MKFLKASLLASAAAISFSASAQQFQFVAGDKSLETQICVAAANNDLKQYKQAVDDTFTQAILNKQGHVVVANKLSCNDQRISDFAQNYQADSTAMFIKRHLKGSVSIHRGVSQTVTPDASPDISQPQVVIVTAR